MPISSYQMMNLQYESGYEAGFKAGFAKAIKSAHEKIGSWITPERSDGDWDDNGSPLFYTCSVCGGKAELQYDFCPNCGKPMYEEYNNAD